MYSGISKGWKNFHCNEHVIDIPEPTGSRLILALIKFQKITATYMIRVNKGLVRYMISPLRSLPKAYVATDLHVTVENMSVIMILERRPEGFYPPIALVALKTPRIKTLTVNIGRGPLENYLEWLDAMVSPLMQAAINENIQGVFRDAVQEATEEIVHLVKK